jgi:HEAT repeat protein
MFHLALALMMLAQFSGVQAAPHNRQPSRSLNKLVVELGDEDDAVRRAARLALMKMDRNTVLVKLVDVLNTDESSVRRVEAAQVAAEIAPEDERVLLAFAKLLGTKDSQLRIGLAFAVRVMNPKPRSLTTALVKAMGDPSPLTQSQVAHALAETTDAKISAPAILEALRAFKDEPVPGVTGVPITTQGSMAMALGSIGQEAMPYLIKALSDKDPMVRGTAVLAIGSVTPGGERPSSTVIKAVPEIAKLVRDQDRLVRSNACDTLRHVGKEAATAIPALIQALRDEDEYVRGRAADALGSMGPTAAPAVPYLIKALKDRRDPVRSLAAEALGRIGRKAKAAVPELIESLTNGDPFLQYSAADALGSIGPDAKAAIPALTGALASPDQRIRDQAAESLRRIRQPPPK